MVFGSRALKSTWLIGLIFVFATVSGCGDEQAKDDTETIDPGLRITGVAVEGDRLANNRTGPAPLEVSFTVTVETLDPRANVEVEIDFGDENDDSEVTLTSLPVDPDPENPDAETQPEVREVTFTHTYEDPGQYTVTVGAIDLTNSVPGEDGEEPVVIRANEQTIDVTAVKLPDLIAVSLNTADADGDGFPDTGPFEIDDPFELTYQVLNDGSDVERAFFVDVYLVARPDVTPAELADSGVAIQLGRQPSPGSGLVSGDSLTETVQVQICDPRNNPAECDMRRAQMAGETWYPAVFVDPTNEARPELNIDEDDEANNYRVSQTGIEIEPERDLPDLQPLRIVANPATTDVLREVTVGFDIENIGETAAPATNYRIFLSPGDRTLDPLDIELGDGAAAPVNQGAQQVISGLSFPLDQEITDAGEFFVIVKVDGDETLEETNESNNFGVADRAIEVTGAQQSMVDLSLSNLSVTPPTTFLGGQIRVQFDVSNPEPDDPGTYTCGIYLSDDATYDGGDRLMIVVGGEALAGGNVDEYDRSLFVPDFIGIGDYWVFVFCDPMDSINETNEDNNLIGTTAPVSIGESPDIDYTLQNLMVTPTSLNEQDDLTFQVEICNDGTDFGGIVEVVAYISGDGTIDPGDREITDEIIFNPIAPGACEPLLLTGKVSCLPFIDTYTAGVIVDPTNSVVEADKTNNTITDGGTITVTGGMGSFCQCVEDSAEGGGNNSQANASPITLMGNNPATASIMDLAICDQTDFYSIPVSRGDSVTATITFDETKGNLDLRLYDANDSGSPFLSSTNTGVETVEHRATADGTFYLEVFGNTTVDRNYFDLDVTVTPSPADAEFYVQDITLTSGTAPNITLPFEFDVEVGNNGLLTGNNVDVTAVLSADNVVDAGDAVLGTQSITVPSLGTATANFSYTWPMSQMSGTFKVIAQVDPMNSFMESDETNNELVSVDITVDAECIPDAFEGSQNNDVSDRAYPIRPNQGLVEFPDLTVCDVGRDDYYFVCVPGSLQINHLGAGNIQSPSFSSEIEIDILDRDLVNIASDDSSSDGITSDALPQNTCTNTADCAGPETCVGGRCQDSSGEHCVYFRVALESSTNVPVKRYSLMVDTTVPNQIGEPANDNRTGALNYDPTTHVLAAGSGHSDAGDDEDWWVLNLDAGTSFDVVLKSATERVDVTVYEGASTSGEFVDVWEPETYVVSSTGPVYFRVEESFSLFDTAGYQLVLEGLTGVDLQAENMSLDINTVSAGDPVLATWDVSNKRLEPIPGGTFDYDYYLSVDQTVDMSDILLDSEIGPAPAPFSSIQLQDKVYMNVPMGTFGDFYLIASIDPANAIMETNETNNIVSAEVTIQQDCTPDSSEPNDTTGTAFVLGSPAGMPIYIPNQTVCQNDGDFFSATIPAGATWEVRIDGMVANSGDIDLFLLDSGGVQLDSSEGLNTTSETITYTNMTASSQDVFIEVRPFRSFFTNEYELTVTQL